jgi:alginate O-acetyltransferase complex protein AlgI
MVFSAPSFLFFFLPWTIALYYVAPRRLRNLVLLGASSVFYLWGAGAIVLVLAASIAINYVVGWGIERYVLVGATTRARWTLALGVIVNVGILAWFKYANFGVDQANGILGALGEAGLPWTAVILPIGISFFTFHALSYLIDIYRRVANHLANPIDFALYIAFFPQLIAGPIVRFHEIREQLVRRTETSHAFARGILRFAHGLGKKVLIADTVAPVVDSVFAQPTAELGTTAMVLGLVAYAVQLYFDFSGYSDMAIGIAMMFGIQLPENFNRPYAAVSITEFWRRWHMSLSRWFRDYLYIPLGGNRGNAGRTYRNLIIVFLITGLWHGANWTFVLWGAYHGLLLLLERVTGIGRDPAARRTITAQARTVVLVVLGWALFRSPDVPYALGYLGAALRPFQEFPPVVGLTVTPVAMLALAIGVASVLLPASWVTGVRIEFENSRRAGALRSFVLVGVLPLAVVVAAAGGFSPFIYFQF